MLEGARRMQLNIQLKPSKDIPELLNVKETIVPLFWVDDVRFKIHYTILQAF